MPDANESFTVNPGPLPEQAPVPSGIQRWLWSFDRTNAWMSIRLIQPDQPFEDWPRWWFKKADGEATVVGGNPLSGRIEMRGECTLEGETMYLWDTTEDHEDDWLYETSLEDLPGTVLHPSQYRICYRRANEDWRCRDENRPFYDIEALRHITDVRGRIRLNWLDHGSHIFHQGSIYIDENEVAHLLNPDRLAEKAPVSGQEVPAAS